MEHRSRCALKGALPAPFRGCAPGCRHLAEMQGRRFATWIILPGGLELVRSPSFTCLGAGPETLQVVSSCRSH